VGVGFQARDCWGGTTWGWVFRHGIYWEKCFVEIDYVCIFVDMSFTQLNYHIVFSTRRRQPLIRRDIERRVYGIIYKLSMQKDVTIHRIGGYFDHVHILASLPPQLSVSEYVKHVKQNSSRIISELKMIQMWYGWEEGYGAFTLRNAEIETVKNYIMSQHEHHRRVTFMEEYRDWLIEQGISPDAPFFPKLPQ
jgi:REP element-mobilizing transposase RayT